VTTLWTHPLADTAGNAPTLAAGEVITILAEYPNPDTANGAVAVNAWTTPAATTDYLANAATGGGGTDYTSSLGISPRSSLRTTCRFKLPTMRRSLCT
jgi:ethanolamine utilization microcompartment shell protein EutL